MTYYEKDMSHKMGIEEETRLVIRSEMHKGSQEGNALLQNISKRFRV